MRAAVNNALTSKARTYIHNKHILTANLSNYPTHQLNLQWNEQANTILHVHYEHIH